MMKKKKKMNFSLSPRILIHLHKALIFLWEEKNGKIISFRHFSSRFFKPFLSLFEYFFQTFFILSISLGILKRETNRCVHWFSPHQFFTLPSPTFLALPYIKLLEETFLNSSLEITIIIIIKSNSDLSI